MPEKIRAWLQFFRIGGVTSALSGSLLGWLVSGGEGAQWRGVVPVLLVSLSIYLFGMGLNDLVDAEKDRELRSGRPLPSGRLEKKEAGAVCSGILFLGLLVMFTCLSPSQIGCFSLAFSLVAVYNLKAKHSRALGPITIGLARSMNVLGGVVLLELDWRFGALGALHFLHALAIFRIAEGEDKKELLGLRQLRWLGMAPLMMFLIEPAGAVLWILGLLWLTYSCLGLKDRVITARLVGTLVGAFTLMEACFLAGSGRYWAGLIFLGLYALGRKMQKAFPAG